MESANDPVFENHHWQANLRRHLDYLARIMIQQPGQLEANAINVSTQADDCDLHVTTIGSLREIAQQSKHLGIVMIESYSPHHELLALP